MIPGSGIAPGEGNATHASRVSQDSKGNKQNFILYKGDTGNDQVENYCFKVSVLMRWVKLEPIIQSEVSQKEKHQYSILTHIYGI